jgi:hypothetical protein
MPVDDPKQNTHRWWGTLTRDDETEVSNGTIPSDVKCVFLKTSKDAHFINFGTIIKRLRVLSDTGDSNEATANILADISADIKAQIKNDLTDIPSGINIVEILEVSRSTPALTKTLNSLTRGLFGDDEWLDGKNIGEEKIRLGRELPSLPL